jgi:hypothetical protein
VLCPANRRFILRPTSLQEEIVMRAITTLFTCCVLGIGLAGCAANRADTTVSPGELSWCEPCQKHAACAEACAAKAEEREASPGVLPWCDHCQKHSACAEKCAAKAKERAASPGVLHDGEAKECGAAKRRSCSGH